MEKIQKTKRFVLEQCVGILLTLAFSVLLPYVFYVVNEEWSSSMLWLSAPLIVTSLFLLWKLFFYRISFDRKKIIIDYGLHLHRKAFIKDIERYDITEKEYKVFLYTKKRNSSFLVLDRRDPGAQMLLDFICENKGFRG